MKLDAQLSPREAEIAELLAWGASKKEIAGKLYRSPRTIQNTARNIYEKAEVNSVAQLSAWYFCKRFNISHLLNPMLSVFFMMMVTVNEINPNADNLRVRTTKTA